MSSSATFRSAIARVEDMVSGRLAGRGEATAEQAIARVPSGGSNGRAHTTSDRAFKALALAWANEGSDSANRAARARRDAGERR